MNHVLVQTSRPSLQYGFAQTSTRMVSIGVQTDFVESTARSPAVFWLDSSERTVLGFAWDHYFFPQEAMAAAVPRVPNIAEQQVLRFFAADFAGLKYHHRVLFHHIEGSRCVVGTPDHEI